MSVDLRRAKSQDPTDTTSAVPGEAVAAFDAIAGDFDATYGSWASVAAQRRAVRRQLERIFPVGARLLELGGGTGEDAVYLAARGRHVLLTDAAPRMLHAAQRKVESAGLDDRVSVRPAAVQSLHQIAADWTAAGEPPFDGAYSNFAALNCVEDLKTVAHGLANLLRTGGAVALVLFGTLPPGEILLQLARGRPGVAFRRFRTGAVPARLGGRSFSVWYHRPGAVARAFRPWFRLERRLGIGVFVPPSAAEPAISRYPRALAAMERLDVVLEHPLALLGDHVLFEFTRTEVPDPTLP